jgi:hypothetical protein
MSLVLQSSGGGQITIQEPNTASNFTQDLPAVDGTILTSASQSIPKAALPTGSVLQVVSTTKTDTFTASATETFQDVTGLSALITPISSSSKILIIAYVAIGSSDNAWAGMRLLRGSTNICIGDASGSRSQVTGSFFDQNFPISISYLPIVFLDSPATTSSTTYKIQINARTGFGASYVNRTATDNNDQFSGKRAASTITVMEIAA